MFCNTLFYLKHIVSWLFQKEMNKQTFGFTRGKMATPVRNKRLPVRYLYETALEKLTIVYASPHSID